MWLANVASECDSMYVASASCADVQHCCTINRYIAVDGDGAPFRALMVWPEHAIHRCYVLCRCWWQSSRYPHGPVKWSGQLQQW